MELAFKKFTTIGVQQVTMDDLARGSGIGKGTLYKFFPSKEALLMSTVDFFASRMEKSIEQVLSDETIPTAEKLRLFLKTVAERLSKIHPAALTYLERTMPEVYEKIDKTRERIILTNLVKLLSDGKSSGLFDPALDEMLIAHMIIGTIRHVLDVRVITTLNYSLDRLFTAITTVILKGCLTQEGRKLTYPEGKDV
jgi:AcrR family transcriptional regulator